MLDVLVILLVVLGVLWSNRRIAQSFGPAHGPWYKRSLDRLFLYHSLFSVLFQLNPGDSTGYWHFNFQQLSVHSDKMSDYFDVGTSFLLWLDFIPARVMGLSLFTGNVLYGVCGFLGLRFLFLLFVPALKINVKIMGLEVIPFLFYLPNLNFWTGGIGKDTLSFFAIAWFMYGLVQYRRRIIQMALAVFLIYYIRPHMGLMILLALAMAIIFSRQMKPGYKLLFLGLAIGGFMAVYQRVAVFLMVRDLSVSSLKDLASDKAGLLATKTVGSAVDINSYSIPMRLFTYLFRPLFFDAHSFLMLMSSAENVVYLVITIIGCRSIRWRDFSSLPLWLKTGLLLFLAAMIVFANSLGNLGIIMREKNMTMIYLLMGCIWAYSRRRSEAATVIQQGIQYDPLWHQS